MRKSIFTHYKDRLVEIGGSSKCIYLKGNAKRGTYDLGRIFEGREAKVSEFVNFLWNASSKRPFSIISAKEKREILENIDPETRVESARQRNAHADTSRSQRADRRDEQRRAIESEVSALRDIKRECDEVERECGRQELFVGYPFVFGTITQGNHRIKVKAPLLLFPVRIESKDEETAELVFNEGEKIRINPALVLTYAASKRINADSVETEFDDMSAFRSVADVIDRLRRARIKIDYSSSKNIYDFSRFKEPEERSELSVRHAAVLGRFALSSSIYNDYSELERGKISNEALEELLNRPKAKKKAKKPRTRVKKNADAEPRSIYTVRAQDYAQSEVVRKSADSGNVVIFGPPGTGKSQTIVNVIADAIANGRRVLAVSQKRAALDVIYSRLGTLNSRCMYLIDEAKERRKFYEKALDAHTDMMSRHTVDEAALRAEHADVIRRRELEVAKLEEITSVLDTVRPFGLSLAEMYSSSATISKNSYEYTVYSRLIESEKIMSLDFKALSDAVFSIKDNDIERVFYDFMRSKEKNPLVAMTKDNVDLNTLEEVRARLNSLLRAKRFPFDSAKYPYARQLMGHYRELSSEKLLCSMVKLECRAKYPKKLFLGKEKLRVRADFEATMRAIDEFAKDYDFLSAILDENGYLALLDNLISGNGSYLKLAQDVVAGYMGKRDVKSMLASFDKNALAVLEFTYSMSKSFSHFSELIGRIIPIRIYHELTYYEQSEKDALAKMTDFASIRSRIIKLDGEACELAERISTVSGAHEYTELYGGREDNKDFLYQISKKQNLWPVRSTMELYSDYLFKLFPCWLLSPENVSAILPLKKNLFDLVIFDEASQVFIESTVPSIIRGASVIVAGDSKQLRPSSTFMKRYLGADVEEIKDVSEQAALEVESLLDLAIARYDSAHLSYHYRSRYSELIDFSNSAFYSSKLCVAPNTERSEKNPPIERIKVDGIFDKRRNKKEALATVELLKRIFLTRKKNESVGIITFGSDQQSCIMDAIDREVLHDDVFRANIAKERARVDGGEDTSLFVKNLENVQGDERDIIIFSVGYAPTPDGRIHTGFGSLSLDGGENRLNVAVTRAKSKIYVITSIEPEELKVDGAKNPGPVLLKKYLSYVRAVSNGSTEEKMAILNSLSADENVTRPHISSQKSICEDIKERLEKMGYTVDTDLGSKNARISLAIYDEDEKRYLVGVELDSDARRGSDSTVEGDVYKPRFLESRGWNLLRVWCRDFWLSPQKTVKQIASAAEAARKSKA